MYDALRAKLFSPEWLAAEHAVVERCFLNGYPKRITRGRSKNQIKIASPGTGTKPTSIGEGLFEAHVRAHAFRTSLRCILSLIAHAITVMKNWSVAGSIRGHFAPSYRLTQAVYLREFVPEFQRRIPGQQGTSRPSQVSKSPTARLPASQLGGAKSWLFCSLLDTRGGTFRELGNKIVNHLAHQLEVESLFLARRG